MKDFFKKYKKPIIDIAITIAILIALSVASMLVLMACGIIYFDEEGAMKFHFEMFYSFKSAWYGWIIFILIQTVLSILLCVIPGAAMAFIILTQTLYPIRWQAFIISFVSVMLSSMLMYALGRWGGYKLCVKFLGKEDCEKSLELLRDNGTVYFPLMMMFPIFPDDALVMIAGTLKMSLKWFIPSIVFGRGIGIATIIFGLSITGLFTKTWHWIVFVAVCVIGVISVFYGAAKLNAWMKKRKKNNTYNDETSEN